MESLRKSREQMEQEELANLAPYAQFSARSGGRAYPELSHPYRTEFQRDRARVIHSRAFRRLESKTQVFLNGTGDHLRTRLTHTIEVASLSRTIARALALNEDLAEAIALAHDLGHAPFGHTGEETLDRLMAGHGGFDHNAQSLRIVELIETGYPNFPGLNLTVEVRAGLHKHARSPGKEPSLEARIADLADAIAYHSHDLDDGLHSGLLLPEQLEGVDLWRQAREDVDASHPGLEGPDRHATIIRRLIDREVEDVIAASAADGPRIRHSPQFEAGNLALREFLYANLYYHPTVRRANNRACALLADVFAEYVAHPDRLGEATAARVETEGLYRAVCDYLSGMTDRYLLNEHQQLFGASSSS